MGITRNPDGDFIAKPVTKEQAKDQGSFPSFDFNQSTWMMVNNEPQVGAGVNPATISETNNSGTTSSVASSNIPTSDPTAPVKVKCVMCIGTGQINCWTCRGKGTIQEYVTEYRPGYLALETSKVLKDVACPKCYGGKITCICCNGLGER